MRSLLFGLVFLLLLAALPLAVLVDMRELSRQNLLRHGEDFSQFVTLVRKFYSRDVIKPIKDNDGQAVFTHNYENMQGGAPVPATFSIQLASLLQQGETSLQYQFVSDYPFTHESRPPLGEFEADSLAEFRSGRREEIVKYSDAWLSADVALVTPVLMDEECVACHNSHPNSPKKDWKVGDVRGVQVFSVSQPVHFDFTSMQYLLIYFIGLVLVAGMVVTLQTLQSREIRQSNSKLESLNSFLGNLAEKLSVYLSPQIYKSIFSGQEDVSISTKRKKLTIFFSDIKDFTATTDRMEPEQLSILLNEYLTEMSEIALKHGATIDKYVGDAILVFFGDPESQGEKEDAKACVRMAVEMQDRMTELAIRWRQRGITDPFEVRMGINTGFCNVGNFGSEKRMDYTIIGGHANLASRLESLADAGGIVLSEDTYALTKDIVEADEQPAVFVKGISREITPYKVVRLREGAELKRNIVSENSEGIELLIDLEQASDEALESVIERIRNRQHRQA